MLRRNLASVLPQPLKALLRPIDRSLSRIWPSWSAEQAPMLAIGRFGDLEIAYRRSTADEHVIAETVDHDLFFSEMPEYAPREGDCIMDIGAHIGVFSLYAALRVKPGIVYAIEASAETFNLLRINIVLNKINNISAHHLALGGHSGTCTLYHDTYTGNWGHSVVRRLSSRFESVSCVTLLEFFKENDIKECSLVKLNCEGSEFPILLNTPFDVLKRVQYFLVLFHCDLWTANTEDDLVAHLEAAGFSCSIRNRTPNRGWLIAVNPSQDR